MIPELTANEIGQVLRPIWDLRSEASGNGVYEIFLADELRAIGPTDKLTVEQIRACCKKAKERFNKDFMEVAS